MSNQIIPIMIPVPRSPTFEEQLNQKSLEYSTDESLRKAFRDGAMWLHKQEDPWTYKEYIALIVVIWGFMQIIAFAIGLMEGNFRGSNGYITRWVYIFPFYEVGRFIGHWLSQ